MDKWESGWPNNVKSKSVASLFFFCVWRAVSTTSRIKPLHSTDGPCSRPTERRNTARWREVDTKHSSLKGRRRNETGRIWQHPIWKKALWTEAIRADWDYDCFANKTTSGLNDTGGQIWRGWGGWWGQPVNSIHKVKSTLFLKRWKNRSSASPIVNLIVFVTIIKM